ncbi:MAG: hypothetical protein RAP70_08755 [Candidatus Celaenobacter antarcticus]|nr:hypothetical protein [Candidatus Celaenobacter antarcticus]
MNEIGIYITVTITLFGVAYPILLQVIARLDEKYSSENIVGLFDKEIEGKLFRWLLISTLVFIVIWSLKLKPLFQIDGLNFIINNSANILLGLSSILLIISFFFFTRKILIYYTPTKFIQYLRNKHIKSRNDFKYFEGLADILLLSIKQQQRNLSLTLSDFFYDSFRNERGKLNNTPVEYPDIFYETVHKSIEELAILKEKRNYSLEYRTAGGIWLLGEMQGHELSNKTYVWLWRNILLSIQYQQDDLIVYHWQTAHQFYTYSLPYIYKNYDHSSDTFQVSNQDTVNKRISEREKFIEFHYALGGLLTYKKRYSCINRVFNHTNSQPPKYELLPESMYEIFSFYFKVRDPYDREYTWISNQYSFPEQSGLHADSVVKKWIFSYMAVLFLRQYTIVPYLITMKPLDYPAIPKTQGEIKGWIDGLDFFKKLVSEHLENKVLLEELYLDFITKEWCEKNDKVYPLDFIDVFKSNLKEAYNNNALTLPISEEKVLQFETSTKGRVEEVLENITTISNSNTISGEADKWYVNGQRMLQSRDAFSENPEVHHIDFDSFLASVLSRRIIKGVASTFLFKKTKTYLFKHTDFFGAIDKFGLTEQHVIVAFGLNIDNYINHFKVKGLTKEKYKETSIFSFQGSQFVNTTVFILRKSNLPFISTKPISDEIIKKYSLKKISDKGNLHSSIIDLNNTTEEIFNENKVGKEDDEIKKSVLMSIIISLEILWKKNIDVIQLIEFSEYRQKGLPNKISDIEPFDKKKPNW